MRCIQVKTQIETQMFGVMGSQKTQHTLARGSKSIGYELIELARSSMRLAHLIRAAALPNTLGCNPSGRAAVQ